MKLILFMIIIIIIKALDVDNYEFVATSKNGFNGSLVEVGFCRHKKIHMIHLIITVGLNCLKIRRENKESEDRSIIIQVAYSDSHSQGSSTYSLLYACIPCAQGFEIIINEVAIAVIAASCNVIILYDIIYITYNSHLKCPNQDVWHAPAETLASLIIIYIYDIYDHNIYMINITYITCIDYQNV